MPGGPGFAAYMAATSGGTNAAASSSYGSRPPSSSSQNNNQTGQNNQNQGGGSGTSSVGQTIYNNTVTNEDGLTQAEINKIKAQNQAANQAAYQASLAKQEEMRKAIALAYNQDGSSNFQNLDKKQKQQLIDSGFAAAESSGVLGGTFGAEIVSNQLKQALADAKTEGEYNEALEALDRLHGNYKVTDAMHDMGLLNPDQSAVYSFGSDIDRYKGGTYLKDAFYDMQSSGLTPKNYTNYMNKISAFGHSPQTGFGFGGGGGGGYGGYGSGGGGGGGYYYDMGGGMPQTYQRGKVGPGNLQEQVNQAFLSGGKPFAKGGIVSLVED